MKRSAKVRLILRNQEPSGSARSKTSAERRSNALSLSATTVAVRGVPSSSDSSPKQSPGPSVRTGARVIKPGGRIVLFVPNRGYPFETHGIYWQRKYYFGNKLFVNYLPRAWRDKLAPHVRVYIKRDLEKLFDGLPVKFIEQTIIFGAYDNLIVRFGTFGKLLRGMLQFLERTPLKGLGLSHFWVVQKI